MTRQLPDYPAAHSMDTDWFAVDKDGNLALFSSGEDGAVPLDAPDPDAAYDVIALVFLNTPLSLLNRRPHQHAEGHVDAPMPDPAVDVLVSQEKRRTGILGWLFGPRRTTRRLQVEPAVFSRGMLLRSTDSLPTGGRNKWRAGPTVATPDGPLTPVWIETMDLAPYQDLHRAGLCVACLELSIVDAANLAALGLYVFECGDYGTPPYDRVGKPDRAITLSQLPANVRRQAAAVRFADLSFEHVDRVQPIEHLPCAAWSSEEGATYIASDGVTRRPLPPLPPET